MTTVPAVTLPRGRLYREARDLVLCAAAAVLLIAVYQVLHRLVTWSTWWPIVTTSAVVASLAFTTPAGSTTVRHAIRSTVTHIGPALAVTAVVCLPWLAGWVGGLIVTGVREASSAALGMAPHPSLPDPSSVTTWLRSHIPGGH